MKQFLNKYKFILFGVFILIDIILIVIFASKSKPSQNTPTPNSSPVNQNLKYQSLITDNNFQNNGTETTINQIKKIYYPSKSPNRKNEAWYQNNNLILIKEIVTSKETIRISDLVEKYSRPTLVLYGEDALSGFYLYATPETGIAYLGNQESGLLLEIWQFEPTSINLFPAKYAEGYKDKLPVQQ